MLALSTVRQSSCVGSLLYGAQFSVVCGYGQLYSGVADIETEDAIAAALDADAEALAEALVTVQLLLASVRLATALGKQPLASGLKTLP